MSIEAMKLALFALDIVKIHYTQNRHINEAIAALKERLADPMREVQRLGQEIEQEPDRTGMVYYKNDACKAKDAYADDCICWTKAHPPQRTEQEPVAWLCTPDENGLFGLPLADKGCKDCFPVYRHPPQRTWVDLSDEDIEECFTITPDLYLKRHIAQRILDKFKEKNNG